jgi:hypothetical protein
MANTTNFNWETPDDTDLVKDGAAAIRTLGSSIDTSFVDLKGGTTGQILSKASNTDLDYTWVANDQGDITEVQAGTGISVASGTGPIPVITNTATTTIDAEGDLLVGDAADALQRLAIGSNGNVLTVDTAVDGKIKWAAPAGGGGKVLQVVSATTSTNASTATATYIDSNLTASITPSSATSKVLVLFHQNGVYRSAAGNTTGVYLRLMRDSTEIMIAAQDWGYTNLNQVFLGGTISGAYLDSPSTTSATTYKTQFKPGASTFTAAVQESSSVSVITLLEIGA